MFKKMACALMLTAFWPGTRAHAEDDLLPVKQDVAGKHPQPEFDPLGVRLGPWVAMPSLRVDTGYDDNLFSTRTTKVGDGFVILSPALSLDSDWAQHGLDFSGQGTFTRYYQHQKPHSNEYALHAGGHLDMGHSRLSASASTSLTSEQHGASGASLSTGRPSQFQDTSQQIALAQDLSPLKLGLSLTHGEIRYNDLIHADGSHASQTFRDSNQWTVQGSAVYAPTDIAALGLSAQYQRSDADRANHSSDTFSLAGKGAIDFGLIRIEGEAAYLQRHYSNSPLRDFNGLSYSGTVSWYPTSLLSLSLGTQKSLENSGIESVGVIVIRKYRAEVNYEILRNLLIQANFSENRQNFREIGVHTATHTQEIKGEYRFNRTVAFGAYARHQCKDSSDVNQIREFCALLTGVSLTYRR